MIESFEVDNFRAFQHLRLKGLKTVNLIVGKSASGKTALLEAIRIGLGATPQVAWVVSTQRGLVAAMQINPTREQFEAAWRPYFFDFHVDRRIQFRSTDSAGRTATLEMYFDPGRPVTPLTPSVAAINPGITFLTNTIIPLAFERTSFSGDHTILDATVHAQQHGQLNLQQGPELGTISEFFPSTWQSNSQQVAAWFSQLRVTHKSNDILKVVTEQFPEVTGLSSETPYGIGAIYATVRHKSEMIPISHISSGLNKFVSLLIAIRTYKGGVVLIDEIENGIYFRMFPALWMALHRFAKENRTQLFVSSHSLECLKGAATVIDRSPDDFSLIQVVSENGASKTYSTEGRNAAAAIEADIETRV